MSLSYVRVTTPIVVTGPLPDKPFECTACVFASFRAKDAVFQKTVDLRGTEFMGRVDLQGATFQGPALFGPFADVKRRSGRCPPAQPSLLCYVNGQFDASADFSLATFDDVASFGGVAFLDRIDFSLARFRDEADFGKTAFGAPALFGEARFTKAASFLGADFDRLDFQYVRSSASVDFGSADFSCTLPEDGACTRAAEDRPGPSDAVFAYSAFNEISFDQAAFETGAQLWMAGLQANTLVFPPSEIHHVLPTDREHVLSLVEASAKSTNDLGVANEAHYRLQALKSRSYSWPLHVLDFVFYRSMAGYLVEPFQPLLTLLALALLVSLLRLYLPRAKLRLRVKVARQGRSERAAHPPARQRARSRPRRSMASRFTTWAAVAWAALRRYGHELLDTLFLMWPGSGAATAGRRFEANIYRILVVCMLIGFANSNPTLRQMLDALH